MRNSRANLWEFAQDIAITNLLGVVYRIRTEFDGEYFADGKHIPKRSTRWIGIRGFEGGDSTDTQNHFLSMSTPRTNETRQTRRTAASQSDAESTRNRLVRCNWPMVVFRGRSKAHSGVRAQMKRWSILYRWSLSSCNYAFEYRLFTKTTNTRKELSKDKQQLTRLGQWVHLLSDREIGMTLVFHRHVHVDKLNLYGILKEGILERVLDPSNDFERHA